MYPANIVSKRRIGRGQTWVIAFVWLLLFAIPLLFGEHPNGINWEHIRKIWTEYMLVFIIFLFNRLVLLPHLFFKGKRLWYFVSILAILLIGFDSGLMFFSKWMQSEQNKLKAEKESIKNKMDFLQTQISPHFLMNTLNNIHALVDIDPAETKESIIRLSEMMDYMLYKSQAPGVE